jgi:hypothetical protein
LVGKTVTENRLREAMAMEKFRELGRDLALAEPAAPQSTAPIGRNGYGWMPLDRQALERVRGAVARPTPLVVREYAAPRPGSANGVEPDTVLWKPVIVLPSEGRSTLDFTVGDHVKAYEVVVAGHTLNGRIGATRMILQVTPSDPSQTLVPLVPGPPK